MKEYFVKYRWPKNSNELYLFVCMADNIDHAIEQCLNAYDCSIYSVACNDGSFLEIYKS
jgi:hypothetical protein